MLRIKTVLREVKGMGIGLFADQDVKKGNLIWQFDENFDQLIDPGVVPSFAKKFFDRAAPLSFASNKYILCLDDARFMNHSEEPCIKVVYENNHEESDYAARDIKKGEEITINYRDICKIEAKKKKIY